MASHLTLISLPDVLNAFQKIRGTDKLVVSYDIVSVTFPGHHDAS